MDQQHGTSESSPTGIDIIKPIILVCVVCSISLSPLTFQLTNSVSGSGDNFQEDLFVYVALLSLCSVIAYLAYHILKQRCQLLLHVPDPRQVKSILSGVFSAHSIEQSEHTHDSPNKSTRSNTNRRRIDPKYFKPKFIINELMTIWGTTYTVITWGSVWVIGGTIVATERLAQKIKTKCTSPQQQHHQHHHSSRGTGRFDSFSSYDSNDTISIGSSNSAGGRAANQTKSSYRRMRSWARKSYANARKRLNRFMSSGVTPQLTDRQSAS